MQAPALIVGLGNPGARYEGTRHNAGFLVLERSAERWGGVWESSGRFRADVARVNRAGRTVWLCRPQTFMNLSGDAVGPMARYYQVPMGDLMVVLDDADLPLGTVRMRDQGGSGGHHGLESLSAALGGYGFGRQRLGIGRRTGQDRELVGHVLGRFEVEERALLERVLVRAVDQLECWLAEGVGVAMNRFNGTEKNAET